MTRTTWKRIQLRVIEEVMEEEIRPWTHRIRGFKYKTIVLDEYNYYPGT